MMVGISPRISDGVYVVVALRTHLDATLGAGYILIVVGKIELPMLLPLPSCIWESVEGSVSSQ